MQMRYSCQFEFRNRRTSPNRYGHLHNRLDLWHWYSEKTPPLSNPRRIITDDNGRTQAALDGRGWTMADALMQQELDNGTLVAHIEHQLRVYGYALMLPGGRHMTSKVEALRNWLMRDRR